MFAREKLFIGFDEFPIKRAMINRALRSDKRTRFTERLAARPVRSAAYPTWTRRS